MKILKVFTAQELIGVRHGSLTYYMASELFELGAPIAFNRLNVDLKVEDIEIFGFLQDRIRQDGAHEFIFEVILEKEGR